MKRILTSLLAFCLTLTLAAPALALEYDFDGAEGTEYGDPTSQEPVLTPDGGERKNEDVSKNAALIPPTFGSPSADTPGTGDYLTPNLAPGGKPGAGETIGGTGGTISGYVSGYESAQYPPAAGTVPSGGASEIAYDSGSGVITLSGSIPSGTGFTAVTDDLYYSDGSLGTLSIPAIGVSTKIYEGTGTDSMKKGAAHFEDTSIWDGNICLAGVRPDRA